MGQPQQQKPTRVQRFWDFVTQQSDKKKGNEYQEEAVTGNAIRVVSDGKLESRLKEYRFAMELINERVNISNLKDCVSDSKDRLQTLNIAVQRIAGVYARAGDNPKFSKLMHGWDKLYSNAISKHERVLDFFTDEEKIEEKLKSAKIINNIVSTNRITVKNLNLHLHHLVYPDAYDVLNYCFRDMDVRERAVTLIQNNNPMMAGTQMDPNKDVETF